MEDALLLTAKVVSIVLGLFIIAFSWGYLPSYKSRLFFSLMIAGFSLSAVFKFKAPDESWTLGTLSVPLWLENSLFYGGQIFFIAFISQIFRSFDALTDNEDIKKKNENQSKLLKAVGGIPFLSQLGSFLKFLAEQGIQHVLAVFLTIAALSYLRVRVAVTDFKDKKPPLGFWILALISLTMLHIGEFFIESQKIIAFPEGIFELSEFVFLCSGLILLGLSAKKLSFLERPE